MSAVPQSTAAKQDWRTPRWFYDKLDARFGFAIDIAADSGNALAPMHYSREVCDAFSRDWASDIKAYGGGRLAGFCNPPYQAAESACKNKCIKKSCVKRGYHTATDLPGVGDWLAQGCTAAINGVTIVFLLRIAGMTARWYEDFAPYVQTEIIVPRLNFDDPNRPGKTGAPTGSMLMLFTPETVTNPQRDPLRQRFWRVTRG